MLKKLLCGFMSVIMFLSPLFARADDFSDTEDAQPTPFELTLVTEGVFVAASGFASREPKVFGAAAALLLPSAVLGSNLSTPTSTVGVIGSEALAIYNLRVDTHTRTRTQIFQKNMIGWNALALTIGITGYIMGDFGSNKSRSVSFMPTDNGGAKIMYSYNF